MLKVVIVGYGEMFTNLIAATLDAECEVVGVFRKEMITLPTVLRKFKDMFNPSVEYNYIKSYNLPEIEAESINSENFRKKLLKLNPDIMLVGSWGEKIEKATFDIPKIASINAHPSLLPKYRGPNPYFWTIRNQEKNSGISFHLLDNDFDSGAILAQDIVKILPNDTGETLKRRTVLKARGVACELLKDLREDIIIPLKQLEEKASYFSHPKGFELDFTRDSEDNYALVRAICPWGKAYFYNKTTPFSIDAQFSKIIPNNTKYTKEGTVVDVDANKKSISVLCSDNKILELGGLSLYGGFSKLFTKIYIKKFFKVGDNILDKNEKGVNNEV